MNQVYQYHQNGLARSAGERRALWARIDEIDELLEEIYDERWALERSDFVDDDEWRYEDGELRSNAMELEDERAELLKRLPEVYWPRHDANQA